MKHQAKSEVLRERLRQLAHGARMLTAHTVGTTGIMLGSLIARSLVGPLPGSEPATDLPPSSRPDASSVPAKPAHDHGGDKAA